MRTNKSQLLTLLTVVDAVTVEILATQCRAQLHGTMFGGVSRGAVEAECVLSIGAVSGRRCLRRRS